VRYESIGWLVGFVLGALCVPTCVASTEVPVGFTLLFNGKDLTGWKGQVEDPKTRASMASNALAVAQTKADKSIQAHWKVVDGVLEFDGKGQNLCTAKDYGDFELWVDWKILKGGDSGIFLRGSPQIQIWDTTFKDYLEYGSAKGSGGFWNNEKEPKFPLVHADKPVGQWNTFYIRMVGKRATIKLNGQLIVDKVVLENYWEPEKPIYPTGQIELQSHGNKLWFRNIFIREIDPKELSHPKPKTSQPSSGAQP